MMMRVNVAVIGGGLAGLCVADRLWQRAPQLNCRVFEATGRVGGKLRTDVVGLDVGRFVVEAGPDAWLAHKPWATELISDLGLADEVIPINHVPRSTAILKHGRRIDLPDGLALVAPTKAWPFLRSRLLSPAGVTRLAGDLVLPARTDAGDESFGGFVRRRLGREALDWIAEPLGAGIHNGDPDQMSLLATFPQLRGYEQRHGSVLRGARAARQRQAGTSAKPAFLSLRGGVQTLTDALVARNDSTVSLRTAITGLEQMAGGGFVLSASDGASMQADVVVLAIPAASAAHLLTEVAPSASARLRRLRAIHAGTISLAYRTADIPRPLSGYGLVIPARECRPINAITVSSRKLDFRAPAGWMLLRVFFGGTRSPATMELDDTELETLARNELEQTCGIVAPPAFSRINRWTSGSPQYDIGHIDTVAAIEAALPAGIALASCPYRGVGIPDVIHAARDIADRLTTRSTMRDTPVHHAIVDE